MEPWDVDRVAIPPELRERAVRMVAQVRPEYPSDWPGQTQFPAPSELTGSEAQNSTLWPDMAAEPVAA
jgi:hypothetical protein